MPPMQSKPPATDNDIPDVPKEQVRATANCPSCGKSFTSKKTLASHARSCKAKGSDSEAVA